MGGGAGKKVLCITRRRVVKKPSKQQHVSTTGDRIDSCDSVQCDTQSENLSINTITQEKSVVKALTFEDRDYLEADAQTKDAVESGKKRRILEIARKKYLSYPFSKRPCLTGTVNEELSRINDRLGSVETSINHVAESVDRLAYFLKNSHLRFYLPARQ